LPAATYTVREVLPANTTMTKPAAGLYSISLPLLDDLTGKDFGNKVAPPSPISLTAPAAQAAVEGTSKSFSLGSFSQNGATSPFTVAVNWGDGSAQSHFSMAAAGTIPATAHKFSEEGVFTVSETVTDNASHVSNKATFSVNVADATLSGSALPISATLGKLFSTKLATFTDSDPAGVASDYKATITWGDGSTSAGTISLTSGTTFSVSASHTYTAKGSFNVVVKIVDSGGATISPTNKAVVSAAALGSISGQVFADANGDGKHETNELGLGLWTVYIDANNDGKLDTGDIKTTTDINGVWSFQNLSAGTYVVRVASVAGTKTTTPGSGLLTIKLAGGAKSIGNLFGEIGI
jgi:SdrD B-like protein